MAKRKVNQDKPCGTCPGCEQPMFRFSLDQETPDYAPMRGESILCTDCEKDPHALIRALFQSGPEDQVILFRMAVQQIVRGMVK